MASQEEAHPALEATNIAARRFHDIEYYVLIALSSEDMFKTIVEEFAAARQSDGSSTNDDAWNKFLEMVPLPNHHESYHMSWRTTRSKSYDFKLPIPDEIENFFEENETIARAQNIAGLVRMEQEDTYRSHNPFQLFAVAIQQCLEQRSSWHEQDLAIEAAINRIPAPFQAQIKAAIASNDYNTFAALFTEAHQLPDQQFEYHLRRYHALAFISLHMPTLIQFWRNSAAQNAILECLHHDAWRVSFLVLRFLYHCNTYSPDFALFNRTLFGWTTGLLYKFFILQRRLLHMTPLVLREWPNLPADTFMELLESDEELDSNGRYFLNLYPGGQGVDSIFTEFIRHWRCARSLRRAIDIYITMPMTVDRVLLGEEEGEWVEDNMYNRQYIGIPMLYDRIRMWVDLREWAFSERNGALGGYEADLDLRYEGSSSF